MRIYIPASLDALHVSTQGAWAPPTGYAVSADLISALEDEEVAIEYARDAAALDSAVELHAPRRVVIVAEVLDADASPAPERHPAAVDLAGPVPAASVVCAFVDEPDATADVAAAIAGDEAALERLEWRDLLWYDVSEFAGIH